MDEHDVIGFILAAFAGVETAETNGDTFFFYQAERNFPFATLVTGDHYETVSNLDRPGVFRLNLGLGKQTFQALFGPPSQEEAAPAYDFAALDTLLPHPVYGRQYWACVLNPSQATFDERVAPLLAEAYALASGKRPRRAAHE